MSVNLFVKTETPENAPITLLLSCPHKDELLLDELKKHLSIMKRQGILPIRPDRTHGPAYTGVQ